MANFYLTRNMLRMNNNQIIEHFELALYTKNIEYIYSDKMLNYVLHLLIVISSYNVYTYIIIRHCMFNVTVTPKTNALCTLTVYIYLIHILQTTNYIHIFKKL